MSETELQTAEEVKGLNLVLTFITTEGRHVALRPKFFDTDLTLEKVKPVMDEMAGLAHLFTKLNENGEVIELYKNFQSAKYVKTVEHTVQ